MTKQEAALAVGAVVPAQVQRVLPFGLLVKLDRQQRGIVRERELNRLLENGRFLTDEYTVGQEICVLVLGQRPDGTYELSQRLADEDPWRDLTARYELGQVVSGTVTGIQPYGVFVEIELDVTGLLHHSRLPAWAPAALTELFWPGDQVQVTIESIEVKRRRLGLSLDRVGQHRWQTAVAPTTTRSPDPKFYAQFIDLPLELLLHQSKTYRIGIIEDDPVQRSALKHWLQRVQQQVVAFGCAETALAHLELAPLDLVLTDIGLPGMDGVAAMHEIYARYPQTRGIVMTDWARASQYPTELAQLREQGVTLLIKPLLPEDLLFALLDIEEKPRHFLALPLEPAVPKLPETVSLSLLDQTLDRLWRLSGGHKVVLFRLDVAQRQVTVLAEAGVARLRSDALVDLVYSPVRDVAEDGQWLRLDGAAVAQVSSQLRYLQPLLPFQSCIGVPVPGEGVGYRYGLFLFGEQGDGLTAVSDEHLQLAVAALTAQLAHQQLQAQATAMQRLALLGNLTRALVHEINHQLSPISFALQDLQYQHEQLQTALRRPVPNLDDDLAQTGERLAYLTQGVRNLVKTARLFGHITIQGQVQLLRLDDLVTEVVEMVRDTADRAHVTLHVDPPPHLLFTRAQVAQVQQMLLNLLLNAIQQIESVRPEMGGRVQVRLAMKERQSQPTIVITVEDDGPGIHRSLWERVFELGFTSGREDGSGLGLYITRSLAEAVGGRVAVAESFMLWGSTFVLELPLHI